MTTVTPAQTIEGFLADLERQVKIMNKARREDTDGFGPIEDWQTIAEYVENELPFIQSAFRALKHGEG